MLPIDFQLRSHSSVLIWLLFAVLPVLLFSALGRDEEDPGSRHQWVAVRRRMLRRSPSPWIDAGHVEDPVLDADDAPEASEAGPVDDPGAGARDADRGLVEGLGRLEPAPAPRPE